MPEIRPNIFGKSMALNGDKTSTGAACIASIQTVGYQKMALRVGDPTSKCPKCGQTGKVITGENRISNHGKAQAVHGSIVQCGCPFGSNVVIAATPYQNAEPFNISVSDRPPGVGQGTGQPDNTPFREYASSVYSEDSRIRFDAQRLIDCAADICEKHLYYPEVKDGFKQEIQSFADEVVQQVESGQISYEQGAEEIQKEEKSLTEQSFDWLANGLSILGGLGITVAGIALCSTAGGCLIGAPLIAHGLNGMYEGGMGFYEGNSDVQGPLREGYKASAKALGFSESVGNLAYDLVDIGISIQGKLKLVPKLSKVYDNRKIKFVLFRYGRKDLDYAFRQANKYLFSAEIIGDLINISKIKDDFKNAFIFDRTTGTIMLGLAEPEKITNIKYVKEHCSFILFDVFGENGAPSYYVCEDKKGNRYDVSINGDLIED